MDEKRITNMYLPLPEGKLHIYYKQTPPDYEKGIKYEADEFTACITIDYVDSNGNIFPLSGITYLYDAFIEASELFLDQAETIHMKNDYFNSVPQIELYDLIGKDKNIESERISTSEYRKKVKKHFEKKWGFELAGTNEDR